MDTANAILSLFLPVVVALVKQSGYSDTLNRLIAIAIYVAWAIVVTVTIGDLTVRAFLANFATTLVTGTIAYQMIWKSFGFDDALTARTSVVKEPEEDQVIVG